MKKVPVTYSAESIVKRSPKWISLFQIAMVSILIAYTILWLMGPKGGRISRNVPIIVIILQVAIQAVIFKIPRRQSILIRASSNVIFYNSGRKQYKVKPDDIQAMQLNDGVMEIVTRKPKTIRIDCEDFPKINMQGFAKYIESIMKKEGKTKSDFFKDKDSGFHVTEKIVLESPNPWPHVLFIGICFLAVITVIYWVCRILFA
jgi:hypothetical protein